MQSCPSIVSVHSQLTSVLGAYLIHSRVPLHSLIAVVVQTLLVYSALIYVMHRRMCEITDDDDNDGDARAEQVAVAKKED